jgi:hypothetical protein
MWMCAAVAFPVRPEKVSFQVSLLPTSLPVNSPFAFVSFTTCLGTSCFALSLASTLIRVRAGAERECRNRQRGRNGDGEPCYEFLHLLLLRGEPS